jgi:hypothetical protein
MNNSSPAEENIYFIYFRSSVKPAYSGNISKYACIKTFSRLQKNSVKCTLVQALRLCTGHMAYRGSSRGIALPFHDHGTRRG